MAKATITEKKKCGGDCQKYKPITTGFYNTNSKFSTDGKTNICKDCIKKMIDEDKIDTVHEVLQLMDLPFISEVWKNAKQDSRETFGTYMKNLNSLPQHKGMTYKDSDHLKSSVSSTSNHSYDNLQKEEVFNVTAEMIKKWGAGFTPEQIGQLEDLYEGMDRCFDIENRSQEEYLKTACLYQMRNIEAIRAGNSNEAKKWGDLFDSYMASGKLKPNQMSESDRMGGITNFSNFFKFIEKTNGFIPTFPDLILDDIDCAIFNFINYNRELLGKPKAELGEVKKFMSYDYQVGQEIIMPSEEMSDE